MKNSIVLIAANGMGHADGVKLVCEGSPVIERLRLLESKGVRLIVCSTCLNYFHLAEKVQVGIVGGMGDILEAQANAEKAITL
jgi:intracellular sulfur oxidation DsrE/DsrF family protein